MEARRSSRAVKPVEVFKFEETHVKSIEKSKSKHSDDEEIDEDEDNSDGENLFSKLVEEKKNKKKKIPLKTIKTLEDDEEVKSTKLKKKSNKAKGNLNNSSFNYIFDVINAKSNIDNVIDKWIANYKINKMSSMVILVNFILISSGAKNNFIALDVDLEALEAEELDELLQDLVNDMSSEESSSLQYPLHGLGKNLKPSIIYRERYEKFWSCLADQLRDFEDTDPDFNVETLQIIVDQLANISTIAISNIRDAVADAALTFGERLLYNVIDIRTKKSNIQRQILAEETKYKNKNKSELKNNSKYQAMLTQKSQMEESYNDYIELSDNIYNSIMIHRLRDSNKDIRALCTRHIGDWLSIDPERLFTDQHIKYVGWMTSDHEDTVRMASIKSFQKLLSCKEYVYKLKEVFERFITRFIDIAVGDIDSEISLEVIKLFRLMQSTGLGDDISEENLDKIDKLVFNNDTDNEVRNEVILFVMDHTEGFEDMEEIEVTSASNKKSKKSTQSKDSGKVKDIEQQQRISQQIETLAEFADCHLQLQDSNLVKLLVNSCLSLPVGKILREWSIMVNLLLRESDDLISSSLSLNMSTFIVKMFVCSALDLVQWKNKLQLENSLSLDNDRDLPKKFSSSSNILSSTIKNNEYESDITKGEKWELLEGILNESLSNLLTRYRDNNDILDSLLDLLDCCNMASNAKFLKAIIKQTSELIITTTVESSVLKISNAFRKWLQLDGALGTLVFTNLKSLYKQIWNNINKSLIEIKNLTSKKMNKNKANIENIEDSFFSLSNSLMRYCTLWQTLDCRDFSEDKEVMIIEVVDVLSEAVNAIQLFYHENCNSFPNSFYNSCIKCSQYCVSSILCTIVWSTGEVFKSFRSPEFNESEIIPLIETIISLRERLVDILQTFINNENNDEYSNPCQEEFSSELQRISFRMIGDIRVLYPVRYNTNKYVDMLVYNPSHEMLNGMRNVFENEGKRIQLALNDEANYENESALKELSNNICQSLLVPLASSIRYDIDNLNRRQTAAIIIYAYSIENEEKSQEIVKTITKKLKDTNIIKYLEVLMVAMKGLFQDKVVVHLEEKNKNNNSEDDDDSFDEKLNNKLITEGISYVLSFAKKLSSNLGVGKLTKSNLEAMISFFKAGINYSFSKQETMGFFDIIDQFIRFLSDSAMNDISLYLDEFINESEQKEYLLNILEDPNNISSDEMTSFYNFYNRLRGEKLNKKTKKSPIRPQLKFTKRSKKKIDDDEEEEEEEDEISNSSNISSTNDVNNDVVMQSSYSTSKVSLGLELEDFDDKKRTYSTINKNNNGGLSQSSMRSSQGSQNDDAFARIDEVPSLNKYKRKK